MDKTVRDYQSDCSSLQHHSCTAWDVYWHWVVQVVVATDTFVYSHCLHSLAAMNQLCNKCIPTNKRSNKSLINLTVTKDQAIMEWNNLFAFSVLRHNDSVLKETITHPAEPDSHNTLITSHQASGQNWCNAQKNPAPQTLESTALKAFFLLLTNNCNTTDR